jgi:hypothetical protein
MSRKQIETLTLRPTPETNRQFEALLKTHGDIAKNTAFALIVDRLYQAMLRKLDDEGLALLEAGRLDQSAWREQRLRYQRRKTNIGCLTGTEVP